ncbi:peptidase C58 [Bradyrhizobium sp. UFLA03-84]|uniref:YopT-type cysteine protease domain-containing protein n=1 Tax=Bradyrhizobium sp. UFLA03-84 TaxID=418599 RepID=UPI000BAE0C83|nr:YopT-type cysteine protease domain-containing protein [Bradyrhizobium sp. UFLA03-84]PAY08602.1 peptidase C58 [Bradyrhizobium sp. UFLA03-84]
MFNPVSGQATRAPIKMMNWVQSADNSNFEQALTDPAQEESQPPEALSDKMGLCCSRPEPSQTLFQYRTAELPGANVDGICVGLAAEWLLNLASSPSSRMSALIPGAQSHASAAVRQQRYEELKALLRIDRPDDSTNLQAKTAMLREAGLEPANNQTRYEFGTSSGIAQIVNEVTHDPSDYLIGLRFKPRGAHTIATSTSNGMTTLFDPNYGEFSVRSNQMGELFKSLGDRYSNVNGLDIFMVVTQSMT